MRGQQRRPRQPPQRKPPKTKLRKPPKSPPKRAWCLDTSIWAPRQTTSDSAAAGEAQIVSFLTEDVVLI